MLRAHTQPQAARHSLSVIATNTRLELVRVAPTPTRDLAQNAAHGGRQKFEVRWPRRGPNETAQGGGWGVQDVGVDVGIKGFVVGEVGVVVGTAPLLLREMV